MLIPGLVLRLRYFRKRSISNIARGLPSANDTYNYFEYQFRFRTRRRYWIHSRFFKQAQRGFGEPAFHAFWEHLFAEFHPKHCLEIGVYRGQILSLWTLLQRDFKICGSIVGITPLSSAGDNQSNYPEIDYRTDIQHNFRLWDLSEPSIIAENSNSSMAIAAIKKTQWDLIYIDGCHELEVVQSDFLVSLDSLCIGGLLVLDDSSLFQARIQKAHAFAGHYGPSIVAETLAKSKMVHLLRLGHLNLFKKHEM